MNIAILIFLIINSLFIAMFVIFAIGAFCDSRSQAWKRCHKAEDEANRLRDTINRVSKDFQEYQKRYAFKSKYKLNQRVFFKKHDDSGVHNDLVGNGIIKTIHMSNEGYEYEIDLKDFRTITVKEHEVYLEK